MDEAVLADLKLAVTEACGNAVRHAHGGTQGVVRVRYEMTGETIEIAVEDEGTGIPRGRPGRGGADVDNLSEGGMGLAIIRAVVDELQIDGREAGPGTVVRMRKRLVPA